jgi:hypothetical protein
MSKEEYLALAAQKYEDLQKLNENLSFYEYEKSFDALWVELGREVLEKNIGPLPESSRKKTVVAPVTAK